VNGIVHPFSKALYERTTDGNILVTDGDKQGLFRRDGSHLEGDLFECDPHLCGWIAGPQVASHRLAPTTPA
jgi:hypothetical protein